MNDNQESIKAYASFLSKLSGNELALIATFSGYIIAQGLSPEEQNSIGNFFEAVGQTLLCIGSQEQYLQSLRIRNKR